MKNLKKMLLVMSALLIIVASCKKEKIDEIPELGTTEIKYVSDVSATIVGKITDKGEKHISERGACWHTSPGATIDNNKVKAVDYQDNFTCIIKDLSPQTKYYVRAYATNSDGTAYGTEVIVTTTSSLDDIDGNSYKTVVIGTQTWMAANLMTTKYNDGTSIPNVTDNNAWTNLTTPAYSWWENNVSQSDRGAYYNYYAVHTGNLCPTGWRVSTENDWDVLLAFLGDEPGDKLKATPTATYNKANETGFTAYMRGYRAGGSGTFARAGEWGWFWIDDGRPLSPAIAARKELKSDSRGVNTGHSSMETGANVRCVKE